MTTKLAFPGWNMGQVLLPEQFRALEQTMLAQVGVRTALHGLPMYGLASLQWSESSIPAGDIHIDKITYLFPSGLLLDVPGNAEINNINLAELEEGAPQSPEQGGDARRVSLYLHVRNDTRDAANSKVYLDDEPSVTRVMYQAVLSTSPLLDDARESERIAELVQRNGLWELSRYSPPLLSLGHGAGVFLQGELDKVRREVERLEGQLAIRSTGTTLAAEQMSDLARVRAAAYRLLGLLGDHGIGDDQQEIWQHPYTLFSAVREFVIELSILQGTAPQGWPLRYRHDDLATCFHLLGQGVSRYIGESDLVKPQLDFERRGDWYVTGEFPDALVDATEVRLIVWPGELGVLRFDDIKLASPRRVEEVYTRALAGVGLTPLSSSSLSRTYGRDASFFTVRTRGDEEWDAALRERALCFPALAELRGVRAAIVWGA